MKGLKKEVSTWKRKCDELTVTRTHLESDLKAKDEKLREKQTAPPRVAKVPSSESLPSTAKTGCWGKSHTPKSSVRVSS